MTLLDNVAIKIKLRPFDEQVIAIVTLNINEEIEIRFCPMLWKQSRTGIFFTMPSLKNFHFQSCVIVLDKDEYAKLQERIKQEFLRLAKDYYHPNEFDLIQKALNKEKEEEINIDEINP